MLPLCFFGGLLPEQLRGRSAALQSRAALYWSPMSKESETKLVPVRVFSGGTASLDAELARNVLAAEGIESMLPGDIAAETIPVLEVQLLVREEDAPRAVELLQAYFDTPGESPVSEE